ncbi:MAG: dCTP deaminase [Planctomycetes bacterium]|nr:dCTP deaminase [Planctomycetota bacterium]
MILSNVEIHRAIDERRLVITPEPEPRFRQNEAACPYQTSSVDLRLGSQILIPRGARPFNIDLQQGKFADLVTPENFEERFLREDQPYSLRPNTLVLAQTLEYVELPIQESGTSLAARIEGRSSFARCGMLVHFTAPTIHAGFRGTITLEIINLGPTTIVLYPATPVCQLIVEEVKGYPLRNDSQFQGQTGPGAPAGAAS